MKTSHILIVVLVAAGAVAFYGLSRPSKDPAVARQAQQEQSASTIAGADMKSVIKSESDASLGEAGSKAYQDEMWARGVAAGESWVKSGNRPLDTNSIETRAESELGSLLAEVLWSEGFFLGQLKARSS